MNILDEIQKRTDTLALDISRSDAGKTVAEKLQLYGIAPIMIGDIEIGEIVNVLHEIRCPIGAGYSPSPFDDSEFDPRNNTEGIDIAIKYRVERRFEEVTGKR